MSFVGVLTLYKIGVIIYVEVNVTKAALLLHVLIACSFIVGVSFMFIAPCHGDSVVIQTCNCLYLLSFLSVQNFHNSLACSVKEMCRKRREIF